MKIERTIEAPQGFTLVELMIVVAIVGIIAAIAIPQYLAYVATGKARSCQRNFEIAVLYIASELKKPVADRADDAVAELNKGLTRDPYHMTDAGFVAGSGNLTTGHCQIGIENHLLKTATPGTNVIIRGHAGGDAMASPTQMIQYVAKIE